MARAFRLRATLRHLRPMSTTSRPLACGSSGEVAGDRLEVRRDHGERMRLAEIAGDRSISREIGHLHGGEDVGVVPGEVRGKVVEGGLRGVLVVAQGVVSRRVERLNALRNMPRVEE